MPRTPMLIGKALDSRFPGTPPKEVPLGDDTNGDAWDLTTDPDQTL